MAAPQPRCRHCRALAGDVTSAPGGRALLWRRRTSGCCSRCDCEGPPVPRHPALARAPPTSYLPSPRRYRDLHTFELQAPTRLIEWARGSRECEAGSAEGRRGTELGSVGEGWLCLAGGKKEAQGAGRGPCRGRRGKGGCGVGPGWGPGGEAKVQGQDPKNGAKWLELYRVQPGLELWVWESVGCAVTRVRPRDGGLGRGAALTVFLALHAHPPKVCV